MRCYAWKWHGSPIAEWSLTSASTETGIKGILTPVGFTDCKFFESQRKPQGEGVHCFLALGDGLEVQLTSDTDWASSAAVDTAVAVARFLLGDRS